MARTACPDGAAQALIVGGSGKEGAQSERVYYCDPSSLGRRSLGVVFTILAKRRLEADRVASVDVGPLRSIDLRLTEVQWYRRSIDHIPGGHTAGLGLEGTGMEAIAVALASEEKGESILLHT